ncbi:MAG: ABC transporter permease, partial [Anaerolineae bacterium]
YDLSDVGSANEVHIEDTTPPLFKIEKFPSSVEQNVPGYAIFGVFFIVGVLAGSILNEKESGTFRRLQAAPLSNTALLLGKLLPYYLVNLIQVALMFAIGKLVFGMNLGNSPAALVVITLATAAAATGLGLLVAALGKTRSQVSGISTLLALTLAAIGGMMVPVFVMPEFMQTVAKISPHYWALNGYQDVIVRGLGVGDVLYEAGVLLIFAAVFYAFAVWKFRFE